MFGELNRLGKNSTPPVKLMADFAPLGCKILKLFPNGKMPPKRTSQAFFNSHLDKPCFFGPSVNAVEKADFCGGQLRAFIAKVREISAESSQTQKRQLFVQAGDDK